MEPRPELEALATALGKLRSARAEISIYDIATATGISHTTIRSILAGQVNSSWRRIRTLTEYFGGDLGEIKTIWSDAQISIRTSRTLFAHPEIEKARRAMNVAYVNTAISVIEANAGDLAPQHLIRLRRILDSAGGEMDGSVPDRRPGGSRG